MRKLAVFAASVAFGLWATAASAAITTYSTLTDWQNAVNAIPGLTTFSEPFNGSGLLPSTGVNPGSNGIIGPARGTGLTGSVWQDFVSRDGGGFTTFSSLGPLRAAAANWDTTPNDDGQGLVIKLNLTGGGLQTVTELQAIHGSFFGFSSTLSFDSFTISAGTGPNLAETFDMDNLKMAVLPTPEPSTLLLVGTGLTGLAGMVRRRLTRRN